MTRTARVVYRALEGWPHPDEEPVATPFSASWSSTLDLLLREADFLDAPIVVIELDIAPGMVRRDEQLRADARAASEKVRVSMTTSRGPMAWSTGRYRTPMRSALGWRENVRAIALTMESLRAVDRYGAVRGEQYTGFLAIEAGATSSRFTSADDALRWIYQQAKCGYDAGVGTAYKQAVRRLHPDRGGDPAQWDRLDEARRLLESAGAM